MVITVMRLLTRNNFLPVQDGLSSQVKPLVPWHLRDPVRTLNRVSGNTGLASCGIPSAKYHPMITNWPVSPVLMLLSFPLLCGALMMLVHGTVQFVPRTIREHHVSYRQIRTHFADLRLIIRLLLTRKEATAAVPVDSKQFIEAPRASGTGVPLSAGF
jgi:hypothetical protein